MDEEVWRDIKGYKGLYQVSSNGRVKSLERVDSLGRRVKEKILSPGKSGKGYLFVYLCKEGKPKKYQVHRLVLSAFSPVADMDKLQVNHINEKKDDNRLENLEWITHKDNQNHGTRNARIAEKLRGKFNTKCSIPIVQLSLDGKYIRSYKSSHDAQRLGGFDNSAIIACCKGKSKTHKEYRWQYLHEYISKIDPRINKVILFGKEYTF